MGRETTSQDDQHPSSKLDQSPRKPLGSVSGSGGGGDRLKRDEWSEGAVTILLEAYESKWILRNRAKLKGQDWEDVAKCVSSRESNSKSPKTQTQCKNKIESMKKRYRSESATSDTSSWPLFSRLDHLLRGTGTVGSTLGSVTAQLSAVKSPPIHIPLPSPPVPHVPDPSPVAQPPLLPQHPPVAVLAPHYSQESNDVAPIVKENDEMTAKSSDKVSDRNNLDNHHVETDSSTPALYSNDDIDKDELRNKKPTMMRKRRRRDSSSSCWDEVAESIRLLADAMVRSEQARMDTMKEVERMRVEAEAKRSEMDLKRTEIIANTQLEMARIFASVAGKNLDSSLKIGRADL